MILKINYLYYIDAEVKAAAGNTEMPKHLLGAFVNCYTCAADEDEAKSKAISSLIKDKFTIVNIADCYRVDEDQFSGNEEDNDDGEPTSNDLTDLRADNDVFYGKFFGYIAE